MPLTWRIVRQLLILPPDEQRDELQRKAAEQGWSLEEVIARIPKKVRRQQSRREGGRAFQGPRSQADALNQIVRHGEEWLRRFGSRAWASDDWLDGRLGASGAVLRKRLDQARATLLEVRKSASALERKIQQVAPRTHGDEPAVSETSHQESIGAGSRRH